jgi:uncharacterized membrane protein
MYEMPKLTVSLSGRKVLRVLLAVFFVVAGAMHFLKPHVYEAIMPPWMPWQAFLITLSGAAEIAGGLALSAPFPVARMAALGLVALLILVFPVNIHMAMSASQFPQIHPLMLWFRLPLQFVLIYALLWCTEAGATGKATSKPVHPD